MDATAAALNGSPVWIYHERQEALLCGQHALNNLVQRPIFEFHQLAAIAQELDQLERRVLTAPGELVRASSNVDDRGNFSIQVVCYGMFWGVCDESKLCCCGDRLTAYICFFHIFLVYL
jgi:hypothetical protein